MGKELLLSNQGSIKTSKQHLAVLDLFRIFICFQVFLFHAVIHKYLILDKNTKLFMNLSVGAIFMDAFFIMSGFLLYYLYAATFDNLTCENVKNFYQKRITKIYPQYFIYTLVILLMDKVILSAIPVEIFCLQGFFPMLFNKMGNGGTWFISCLMFSYLLFPFIAKLIKNIKLNFVFIFILYLIILYLNILKVDLKIHWVALYISPIYRLLAFIIGMLLAKLYLTRKQLSSILSSLIFVGAFCLLFLLIPILYKNNFIEHVKFAKNFTLYSCVTVPLFSIIIYSAACIKNKVIDSVLHSKIILFTSKITFHFFIWQGFALRTTRKLLENINVIFVSPTLKEPFVVLLVWNIIVAIIAYLLIDKVLIYWTPRIFNFIKQNIKNYLTFLLKRSQHD